MRRKVCNRMYKGFSEELHSSSTYFNENLKSTLSERLHQLSSKMKYPIGKYNDNTWQFYDVIKRFTSIKFEVSEFVLKQHSTIPIIDLLKSWTILQIEEGNSYDHIQSKVHAVIRAINSSSFFDPNKVNEFNEQFFKNLYSEHYRYSLSSWLIEFFDFIEHIEIEEIYLEIIWDRQRLQSYNENIRTLPSSHDVLKFSLVVEKYFTNDLTVESYIKYFPVYLWWNLTNIIPLRINELCNVKSDCLSLTTEGYFIEIPRSKNANREYRFDHILIPEKLAKEILSYKEKTEKYGLSNTLFSYLANKYDHDQGKYKTLRAKELNEFNYKMFVTLLNDFYEKIIVEKFSFKILEDESVVPLGKNKNFINRKIRPNDTRHFAFLNLMLQGYHPSEIARLGGHRTIHAQYSYHKHLEYWIDSDLMHLLLYQKGQLADLYNSYSQDLLFKKSIILSHNDKDEVRIPLRIGYCTDPIQNCPVDEHHLCEHWRITFDDYQKHYEELQESVLKQKSILKTLIDKLVELHQTGLFNRKSDLYSAENQDFNYQLIERSKEVKHALYQLTLLKERIHNYEK